jgi:hypothetical protein
MYKLLTDQLTNEVHGIRRIHDGAVIPFEPSNIDYQEYLDWVNQGNTPDNEPT